MKQKYVVALHILFWVYYFLQELVALNPNTQSLSIPLFSFTFTNPEVAITYSFTFLYIFIFYLNYLVALPRFF